MESVETQEADNILSADKLSDDIAGKFTSEVLNSDPNVVFFGERHGHLRQMSVLCVLIQDLVLQGKKPGFVGIELKSLDLDKLSKYERQYLEMLKPLVNICNQNEIPTVAIDMGPEKGAICQEREDFIANRIIEAYAQHGMGFVLIGGFHSRKCSGTGNSRGVKTAANVAAEKLPKVSSVLLHEVTFRDPLAREIDISGVPVALSGIFGASYSPRRSDTVIKIFADEIEEQGFITRNDHDLLILLPSDSSEINAYFGEERTSGLKYQPEFPTTG